ncbi:MAG: amidohydrolase family protein [Nannocystaceae bacterium]
MPRLLAALLVGALAIACQTTGAAIEPSVDPPAPDLGDDTEGSSGDADDDAEADDPSLRRVIRGANVVGRGVADVAFADGVIQEIAEAGAIEAGPSDLIIDARGRWLVPAGIDSHVHLDYLRAPEAIAAGGVAVAVDLAAPLRIFDERAAGDFAPLRLLVAGPMLAAPGGYPTQGWGADGYGRECADTDEALAAVDELADRGAAAIKISLAGGPRLGAETLAAVIERAHARGLKVVAHTLGAAETAEVVALGVDALAHTPVEPLSPATLAALEGRAVISTLRAFGASDGAVANLAALREAGATILYGTDFGNSTGAGIDAVELAAMAEAGMDGAAILRALTEAPAAFWGLPHGRVEVGAPASLLLLGGDPELEPLHLAAPEAVFIAGAQLRGGARGR